MTQTKRSPYRTVACLFAVGAALIVIGFAMVHWLGLAEYTAILSGTTDVSPGQAFGVLLYLTLYTALVFIAPILLIAAGLLAGFDCAAQRTRPAQSRSSDAVTV